VAYWTSKGVGVPSDLVKDALRKRLPEFMLPSAFVPLAKLPMTPNGKIDRKALPAPETARDGPKAGAQPIEGDLEQTIADVWKRVLQVESIGADDNFFDIGGHSLLVVQVHRALREACAQKLSLTDLYRFPTVRGLATHLGAGVVPGAAVKDSKTRGELRRQALGGRKRRGAE
jgi:acyl carrier protein